MQRFLYCVLAYTYAINTGSIYCLAGVFTSLISLNFSNSVARRFEQKRKLSVPKIPQHKMIIHQLRRTHASFAFHLCICRSRTLWKLILSFVTISTSSVALRVLKSRRSFFYVQSFCFSMKRIAKIAAIKGFRIGKIFNYSEQWETTNTSQ